MKTTSRKLFSIRQMLRFARYVIGFRGPQLKEAELESLFRSWYRGPKAK